MTEQIRIIDAKEHVNEEVKIGAWLTDKRSSGKIAFYSCVTVQLIFKELFQKLMSQKRFSA